MLVSNLKIKNEKENYNPDDTAYRPWATSFRSLDQCCPIELPVTMGIFHIASAHHDSQLAPCGSSTLAMWLVGLRNWILKFYFNLNSPILNSHPSGYHIEQCSSGLNTLLVSEVWKLVG